MQKPNSNKSFLVTTVSSLSVLLLFKLFFSVLNKNITEANEISFLFIQWICYALTLVFLSVYLLNYLLNIWLSWKKYAVIRFILQLFVGTILSLGSINIAYNFIKSQFTQAPADINQVILLNIYGGAIILPIFASFFGYKFLRAWKKSEIESERLAKENTRSQLLSLRNHLDPHFLFNNLNILSSLMDKDIELSKSYLNKFAEVYRVILKTEYSDLTTLEEELSLIDSYIYLLKIRFKDAIYFDFEISSSAKEMALPPLSIQMLVENAIKHNIATKEKPIYIKIKSLEDNTLIVENNLQKKKYLPQERKATGIINIQRRYEFFTNKKITVLENEDVFSITLPLIEIDYN
ncbi:MAG: histidine kinase [Saprospiraceae bacterium]|nr:histidine kinase [Bacteroidia bacterium]NNL91661.1 histidine kinase [Saprospiraceae bacterium]